MVKILCDVYFNYFIKKGGFLYVAKSICYAVSSAWRMRWKIPGKAMLTISTVLTVIYGLKADNSFLYFFSFLTKVTFEVSRTTSSHYKVSIFRIPTLKLFQSLQMQTTGLLLHDLYQALKLASSMCLFLLASSRTIFLYKS